MIFLHHYHHHLDNFDPSSMLGLWIKKIGLVKILGTDSHEVLAFRFRFKVSHHSRVVLVLCFRLLSWWRVKLLVLNLLQIWIAQYLGTNLTLNLSLNHWPVSKFRLYVERSKVVNIYTRHDCLGGVPFISGSYVVSVGCHLYNISSFIKLTSKSLEETIHLGAQENQFYYCFLLLK